MNHLIVLRKAAVSLNNTAVSLLLRSHVKEAYDTLVDSVILLKMASETQDASTLTGCDSIVIAALQRAEQYSALMTSMNERPDYRTIVKPAWSHMSAFALTQNLAFLHQVPMPVFIEQDSQEDDESQQNFDFECCIVLYNFGLVHLLQANDFDLSVQASLQQIALRLFALAGQVLSIMNQQCCYEAENINEKMLIGMLLMRSFAASYKELNQIDPATTYSCALAQLMSFVRQHFYHTAKELHHAAAA